MIKLNAHLHHAYQMVKILIINKIIQGLFDTIWKWCGGFKNVWAEIMHNNGQIYQGSPNGLRCVI